MQQCQQVEDDVELVHGPEMAVGLQAHSGVGEYEDQTDDNEECQSGETGYGAEDVVAKVRFVVAEEEDAEALEILVRLL